MVGAEEAVAGAVEGETAEGAGEVLVVATVVIAKARQADNKHQVSLQVLHMHTCMLSLGRLARTGAACACACSGSTCACAKVLPSMQSTQKGDTAASRKGVLCGQ